MTYDEAVKDVVTMTGVTRQTVEFCIGQEWIQSGSTASWNKKRKDIAMDLRRDVLNDRSDVPAKPASPDPPSYIARHPELASNYPWMRKP